MAEQVLSRTQRNLIFEMIRANKLDPADFQWSTRTKRREEPVEILRHSPTNAYFEFSHWQEGGWWLSWWPAHQRSQKYEGVRVWPEATNYVSEWLIAVHADHHAPDLWGQLANEKAISGAADSPEYEKQFSAAELKQLETGLADVEQFITTTQPLDPAGKQAVQKRFAYLRDAANRGVRKIDWLNIFVAQMIAMVTEGLLDPRVYGPVMAHAATALNAVFQFGLKLLK